MWAKIHFLAAATTLPQVASDYYYWLDAGCHYPMWVVLLSLLAGAQEPTTAI
jgi:hypothetical protein